MRGERERLQMKASTRKKGLSCARRGEISDAALSPTTKICVEKDGVGVQSFTAAPSPSRAVLRAGKFGVAGRKCVRKRPPAMAAPQSAESWQKSCSRRNHAAAGYFRSVIARLQEAGDRFGDYSSV